VERHLGEMLAWAPYEPTPDYAPRPEPGRPLRHDQSTSSTDPEGLRVPVLNPLA
jgi:lipoyl(octanoyl) transferase